MRIATGLQCGYITRMQVCPSSERINRRRELPAGGSLPQPPGRWGSPVPDRGPARARRPVLIGLLLLAPLLAFCQARRQTVSVFCSGSLAPAVREAAQRFESNHPSISIAVHASDSVTALLGYRSPAQPCRLLGVSDARLISDVPGTTAAETYRFLGSEIVLATARRDVFQTRKQKEYWQNEWCDELISGRYSYAAVTPETDPAGYDALLSLKLAEIYYDRPGLYRRLLNGLTVQAQPSSESKLASQISSGRVDFGLLFKSTAIQKGLRFLQLPAQISQGDETYSDYYSRAFLQVSTRAGEIGLHGAPVQFGWGVPGNSCPAAQSFLESLISPDLLEVYRELGYKTANPVRISDSSGR